MKPTFTTIRLEAKRILSQLEIQALRQKLVYELAAPKVDMAEIIRINCEIAAQRTLIKRATMKLEQAQGKK